VISQAPEKLGPENEKVGAEKTWLKVFVLEIFRQPHAKPEALEFADAN